MVGSAGVEKDLIQEDVSSHPPRNEGVQTMSPFR